MATALTDPALPAALESKGITAPLDLPENAANLQESLALANGIPAEEAMEWLAAKFAIAVCCPKPEPR